MAGPEPELNVHRSTMAVQEARAKRARGERVWCVPFARTMSGIEIRGNAETWWAGAKGTYDRGHQPHIGAVIVFSGTRKLPMGHVAVVSEVVSPREIRVDHANWQRNKVSLGMSVIDVSDKGDWSAVKVESQPGSYGRVYPISGFIYPKSQPDPTVMAKAERKPWRTRTLARGGVMGIGSSMASARVRCGSPSASVLTPMRSGSQRLAR